MDIRASDNTQLGRRERNKLRVKERLYTSALTLFTERGYDETSIDEIADRADVARGTFFNYFQRKEDLISAWGEERREKLGAALSSAPQQSPSAVGRLRQCMSTLGRINEEEQFQTSAMLTAWVRAGRPLIEEPYVAELFAEIVSGGRDQGELSADLQPTHVGNVLRDLYLGTLYRWCERPHGDRNVSLTEELQATLDLLLHGITAARPQDHPTD
ncbi:TetR/AcrR family transcriptional regulator [Streptacidiphilus sp. P02-A3a]|uniref:TetR/AcrR family transcriptional regulator n=1 Tax=Streptacidiphilus sp. P02-A3a TaxID=2704468 RepID=UPI0015FB1B5C|nr:TetR/AcrR family transcriptional regulator [Streptacidiphilus sp. P02-A3a]QMU71242.1 TetR family transcriptional regulator [Streptacidiphilus sp. P02-A3a]